MMLDDVGMVNHGKSMEFIMMTGVLFIPMLSSMVHVHVVQVKKSLRS
jgi:hypothetical protein